MVVCSNFVKVVDGTPWNIMVCQMFHSLVASSVLEYVLTCLVYNIKQYVTR